MNALLTLFTKPLGRTMLMAFLLIGTTGAATAQSDGVAPDARLAANAMILALRDMTPDPKIMPVEFAPGVRDGVVDPKFKLTGFFLSRMFVERFTAPKDNPTHRHLIATAQFQDTANRGVMITFSATYKAENGKLVIYRAAADYVSPSSPLITWFVVPANKVPDTLFDGSRNLAQLHYFIAANGLGALPDTVLNTPGDYYLYGVVFDRLAHGDKVNFRVSRKKDSAMLPTETMPTVNIGGWRIGVYRGTFAPAELGQNVVAFAQLQPYTAPGKPAAQNKMIGVTTAFTPNPIGKP